jgi:hypothetical protein
MPWRPQPNEVRVWRVCECLGRQQERVYWMLSYADARKQQMNLEGKLASVDSDALRDKEEDSRRFTTF